MGSGAVIYSKLTDGMPPKCLTFPLLEPGEPCFDFPIDQDLGDSDAMDADGGLKVAILMLQLGLL